MSSLKIKEIELDSGFEGWGCYLIVMYYLLMCDTNTIVEKFRVILLAKVNVERWGLF